MMPLSRAHFRWAYSAHLCETVFAFVDWTVAAEQRFQHYSKVTYTQLTGCSSLVEIPLNQPHFLHYLSAFSRVLINLDAIARIVVDGGVAAADDMAFQNVVDTVKTILYFLDVNFHANGVRGAAKILDVRPMRNPKKQMIPMKSFAQMTIVVGVRSLVDIVVVVQ